MLYTSDTVETASLVNRQITSDCGGQHWTISGTNLTFMQRDLNGYSQPSRTTLFSLGI